MANWFTFPKKTGKECCQNRCSADYLRGSVPKYGENGSLPLKKGKTCDVRLSNLYGWEYGRQTCIANEGAIYENCRSNCKLSNLCKTL